MLRASRMRWSKSFFFFFQAEDGIRDLVRSRGLGDVYKRQILDGFLAQVQSPDSVARRNAYPALEKLGRLDPETVSYTHLTLPTSDLV